MKRGLLLTLILIYAVLVYSGEWRTQTVQFTDANGNLSSTSATKAGNATFYSSKFQLPWKVSKESRGHSFPILLGGGVNITEKSAANSDSINCAVSIQFSADGTNWDTTHDQVLDTLNSTTADTGATAAEIFSVALANIQTVEYARLKFVGSAAAADSITATSIVNFKY